MHREPTEEIQFGLLVILLDERSTPCSPEVNRGLRLGPHGRQLGIA